MTVKTIRCGDCESRKWWVRWCDETGKVTISCGNCGTEIEMSLILGLAARHMRYKQGLGPGGTGEAA